MSMHVIQNSDGRNVIFFACHRTPPNKPVSANLLDQFRLRDTVRRRSDKSGKVVGEIISINRQTGKARVHWLNGQSRIGGGSDFHTSINLKSLVKIGEASGKENEAVS